MPHIRKVMKGLVIHLLLHMSLLLPSAFLSAGSSDLHPLVLIPGSGGNQLEARLTKAYKPPSLFCYLSARNRKDGWFTLWFDATVLVPPFTQCFADRMMLHYDDDLDDYRNAPGVETRVPHFGSTDGLRYLNPRLKRISEYMDTLVNALEHLGYHDGKNLFGAPYDFRYGLAAEGHPCNVGTQYLRDLKQLIESASSSNGGKPVILLTHSLGGLFALQLLDRSPSSWRRKYVKHLLTLSAPWAGTVQEMLTFASGFTLGIPLVNPLLVRAEQRSSESNLWLLPSPGTFGSKPLVVHRNKSYSALDMQEFLEDIGFKEGVHPYRTRILPMVEKFVEPLGVPVTCLVGTGVDTPETLFYGRGGFDVQPDVVYGDGDGTVNLASLLALEAEWSDVKVIKMPGVSHTGVLKNDGALSIITKEISAINAKYTMASSA